MQLFQSDLFWMLVRVALTTAGTYLTTRGVLTQEELSTLSGAALQLGTLLWQIRVKYGTKAVPITTAERVDVPTVSPVTGTVQPPSVVHKTPKPMNPIRKG